MSTRYSCATTGTCPINSYMSDGSGSLFSYCSTDNCNTGTVARPISCHVDTSATSVTATARCYTNLCQVGNKDLKGILFLINLC